MLVFTSSPRPPSPHGEGGRGAIKTKYLKNINVLNRPLYSSAWNAFENLGRLRSSEERGDPSTELNL